MITDFHSLPADELMASLSSGKTGLSKKIASKRTKEQRKTQKHTDARFIELKLLIRQFTNPLILLLLIAALLSAFLRQASDAIIILALILVTGLMSFWQELNAGKAADKLKKLTRISHQVLREGQITIVGSEHIVPGDVLIFKAGDIIPADCRIIGSCELHVNESVLTGESFPAEKAAGVLPPETSLVKRTNCLWKGTSVISGTARAVAVFTGQDTAFGKLISSLQTQPETAFEKGIKAFGFFLLQITIVLTLLILGINLYFGKPLLEGVLFSLAIAVGMAPELLPAIMTFAMTAGARRMVNKKVIVKKLSSIFNMGEVSILCTDKTGTITEGTVRIKGFADQVGNENELLKQYAFLNSSCQLGFPNPIDDAIKSLPCSACGYEKMDELPYDFIRKRLSVSFKHKGKFILITKGAFTNTLECCTRYQSGDHGNAELTVVRKKELLLRFQGYSRDGLRVLGLASKTLTSGTISRDDEHEMEFLGFILLEDPLKESSKTSLHRLTDMHIQVKMITGDNQFSAAHITKELGIAEPVMLTGAELDKLSSEALAARTPLTNVFAEIEPHQKERIIKALQQSGAVVAYMGDGINDIAALHAADSGISTDNAVDAAKEAADFVLLKKDLGVIADAVYEGRRSFYNSIKYVFITTGATFGNMFSVAGASLLLPFLPMLPKQILLTNLITDLPCLGITSDKVDPASIAVPGRWDLKLVRDFMILFGIHSSAFDLLTFYMLYFYFNLSGAAFRSAWFLESVITEIGIIFLMRTRNSFLRSAPSFNLAILAILAFAFTIWLPYSPFSAAFGLSVPGTGPLAAISMIIITYILTGEWLKLWFYRKVNDMRNIRNSTESGQLITKIKATAN